MEEDMSNLQLAVEIAKTVEKAASERRPLDAGAVADALLKVHPEAQATHAEVVSTLAEEASVSGAPLRDTFAKTGG
jgi:hypothetical protein